MFGWSSGGLLALRAAQAGTPIARLALFEPPVAIDDSGPVLPADYVERLDAAIADGRRGDAVAFSSVEGEESTHSGNGSRATGKA